MGIEKEVPHRAERMRGKRKKKRAYSVEYISPGGEGGG